MCFTVQLSRFFVCRLATASTYQHIVSFLSTTFLIFFKSFFVVVCFLLFSLTAMLEYHMGLPMSTPIFFFFVIFRKIYTIYSRHSIKGRGSSLSNTFPDFFHNKLLSKVQSPALFSGFWTFSIINHSLRSNPLLSSLDFGPSL